MKHLRILMSASLALTLTACSGGNAPAASGDAKETPEETASTPESAPETKAEFTPDQLSVTYSETEYQYGTYTAAAITNNSNKLIISVDIMYGLAEGHTNEELLPIIAEGDPDAMELEYVRLAISEKLAPGETSQPVFLIGRFLGSVYSHVVTPEAMDMLAPVGMTVKIPQDDGTIIETDYRFNEGDFSNVGMKDSNNAAEQWNTWDAAGIEWLPEISGCDYTVLPDGSSSVRISVYDADASFVNTYLDTLRSGNPALQPVDGSYELEQNTLLGNSVLYTLADEAGTKIVTVSYYKESRVMLLMADSN